MQVKLRNSMKMKSEVQIRDIHLQLIFSLSLTTEENLGKIPRMNVHTSGPSKMNECSL